MEASSFTGSVDETARRKFESAWREGRPVSIESVLPPGSHPSFTATLEELVHIELELAWKGYSGDKTQLLEDQPSRLEGYLARFPLLEQPGILRRLVKQEYFVRHRYGDKPAPEEYHRRFPDHVSVIQDLKVTPQVPSPADLPSLPGYTILEKLGHGGMGVVYKATQAGLGRVVAIKMILSGSQASAEDLMRFRHEAGASAQLQHPNIVQVYEVGQHQGCPYFSQEYVSGGTLASRLNKDPQPPRQAAQLLETLARAMHYAHERGIVHRDLKPANVLLQFADTPLSPRYSGGRGQGEGGATPEVQSPSPQPLSSGVPGERGLVRSAPLLSECVPKIADFGLAKRLESSVAQTRTGDILGTPSYMAPEQAEGRVREIGPATDVYALGAILYEMLTGRPPFQGDTPMETVMQVVSQEPVSLRRLLPRMPRDLQTICMRCLEKDPRKRYGTALALAEDLSRFSNDEPILARPVSRVEKLWRWARRRPAVAGLSAALVVVVVGAVVGLFLWQQAEGDRRRQALQFDHEQQQQHQARVGRLRTTAENHEQQALAEVRLDRYASAQKFLHQALETLGKEPELEDMRATIQARHDRIHKLVQFYELSDKAERLAFLEQDDIGIQLCTRALRDLGVLDNRKDWWASLPAVDLSAAQKEQLVWDVYRQTIMLAGLHIREGMTDVKGRSSSKAYRAALETLEGVRHFLKARKLSDSLASDFLEAYCHLSLLQLTKLRVPANKEPATGADCYFVGIAYFWVSSVKQDDMISKALKMVAPLMGIDYKNAGSRAQQMLRRATSEEPKHYWAPFWLGLALLSSNDFNGAELAFNTCITLRREYALGYSLRAQALALQREMSKDAAFMQSLEQRCMDDLARALDLDSHDSLVLLFRVMTLSRLYKKAECLDAITRWIELEPPVPAKGNERLQNELTHNLRDVLQLLTNLSQSEPSDPQLLSLLAVSHLALGSDGEATRHADLALTKPTDPSLAPSIHAQVGSVRGFVLLNNKEFKKSLGEFEKVLAAAPTSYRATLGKAKVHEALGEKDQALKAYDRLVGLSVADWQRLEAHLGRARCLIRLDRTTDARHALDQARELNTRAADALAEELFPPSSK